MEVSVTINGDGTKIQDLNEATIRYLPLLSQYWWVSQAVTEDEE